MHLTSWPCLAGPCWPSGLVPVSMASFFNFEMWPSSSATKRSPSSCIANLATLLMGQQKCEKRLFACSVVFCFVTNEGSPITISPYKLSWGEPNKKITSSEKKGDERGFDATKLPIKDFLLLVFCLHAAGVVPGGSPSDYSNWRDFFWWMIFVGNHLYHLRLYLFAAVIMKGFGG